MQKLRQYEETGLALRKNLDEKIFAELSLNPDPDWGFLLSHFSNASKQLDSLWMDMDPSFQFDLPVPAKPPVVPTDTPLLLSSRIPDEDLAEIVSFDPTAKDSLAEKNAIERHNADLNRILRGYNSVAEKVVKSRQKPNNLPRVDKSNVMERLKSLR